MIKKTNNKNNNMIKNMNNNTMSVAPILSYWNADRQKKDILKDNSKKTGIYKWINKNSGKSYIGSAINLKRFINY